jgi:hypothetical protein
MEWGLTEEIRLPSRPAGSGKCARAKQVQVGVGGKGQDVVVTLSCLQFQGDMQLAQFVGGGRKEIRCILCCTGKPAMGLTARTASGDRNVYVDCRSDSTTEPVELSGTHC